MVEQLVEYMGIDGGHSAIQLPQSEHRLRLIDLWGIPQRSRVLEVGCGQGDTTAALAFIVGKGGLVHGVDIASPSYGAPETLGEARKRLLASPLGPQIRMDFDTDIASPDFVVSEKYDYIVLSHCSWYFSSKQELFRLLRRARGLASRLCFAEWDIRVCKPEQIPHFYAATIQAQCACYGGGAGGNIRTLLSPADIAGVVSGSGWIIQKEASFCSADLQDGRWEVEATKSVYPEIIRSLDEMPPKMKELLMSQIEIMERAAETILPLNTYILTANIE